MWRVAVFLPALLAIGTSGSAQYTQYPAQAPATGYSYSSNINAWLNNWRTLRQSSGYRFSDYATFVIANPDWPDAAKMRRWAEAAMQPGESSAMVIAFFNRDKPTTGTGWARLADAYASSGRMSDATDAARGAWASADLSPTDEQAIWARYGSRFTSADNDRRIDALLSARRGDDASRFLSLASPNRQAAFGARVAMVRGDPDADARYSAVSSLVTSDAGLMMDRARWLRANNYEQSAEQLAARSHNFVYRPADPERFLELLVSLSGNAANNRQWSTAFNIASQLDDVLPAGKRVADQPLGIRDDYTTLAWLAGNVALDRLNHPANAIAMYDRYANGGRSLQVLTKGTYWAGRAALGAGQISTANAYFQRAAAYPELFYGQLALERLGRNVPAPNQALPQYTVTQVQRSSFNARPLVQALRSLAQQGRAGEEALFVRSLSESLNNDTDRNLAVELGQQLARPDLPVWTARSARIKGSMFYVRQAFPTLGSSVSPSLWSLAHGISRQESSFDPYAVSHAGARGIMQLMPGTAREQADKSGIGYDGNRLTSDPDYNVMLGSAYFQRLLSMWDGNVPLAVASYNAGAGNVRKWINAYGDPRGQVDVVKWIEAIPFTETRGYVQRVIENSVVYDSLRGGSPQQTAMHVSRYLGKDRPG